MNNKNTIRGLCAMRGLAILLLAAASGGCATIVKGSNQTVPVASDPAAADILVDGALVGQTPMAVQLKRKSDHLITLQKAGYHPKSIAVVKNVGAAVWGNVLAGGLIGWGVDASTGAQYNLVPQTVSLQLEPLSSTASAAPDDQSVFVSKLQTLDHLHDTRELSDSDYEKGRTELFRHYMPDVLSAGAGKTEGTAN